MSGFAITTRYVGPTDYRGSRIIATGPALRSGGRPVRATVPYSYELSGSAVHMPAAERIVATLRADGWRVTLTGDSYTLPDGSGLVWTLRYGAYACGCDAGACLHTA